MRKIDSDGLSDKLRALLAAQRSEPSHDWLSWSAAKRLLHCVRMLATDTDPVIRRETWEALELLLDESTRKDFYGALTGDLETPQFETLLTETDPQIRAQVRRVILADQQHLAPTALNLLRDDRFDYAWPDAIEVLRQSPNTRILMLRGPVIDHTTLIGVLADAPSERLTEVLSAALGLPAATRVPALLPDCPPTPIDCEWPGCGGVVAADQCTHLPVVIALLGSSIERIRDEAITALCRFGPGPIDALHAARRTNPSIRRVALTALAEFGWHHIPAGDLDVLRRFVRMKQRDETPEPQSLRDVRGAWYALPTTDQTAVLDALDLTDPVPATLRTGFRSWRWQPRRAIPTYGWNERADEFWTENLRLYDHDEYPEVFVTPALDGWTLVLCGNTALGGVEPGPIPVRRRHEMYRRMEHLSRRFGTAHWFEHFPDEAYDELTGDYTPTAWSQWCSAQDGDIRMHCISADDVYVYRCEEADPVDSLDELNAWMETNDRRHEPHSPKEEEARAEALSFLLHQRHGDSRLPPEDQEPEAPDEFEGLEVDPEQDQTFGAGAAARRLSADIEALGPHTEVRGSGVLTVPRALRHQLRRGTLPM